MKRVIIPALLAALFVVPGVVPTVRNGGLFSADTAAVVLLAYHPEYLRKEPGILGAYESVLQEEGVPSKSADIFQIAATDVGDVVKWAPVVILPDGILQHVPERFVQWAREYLAEGGNLLVVYDAGVKDPKGFFLNTSALSDIMGLNTITYATGRGQSYGYGRLQFASEACRDFFQIPAGKTVDLLTLSGYGYGSLNYPLARNEPVRHIPEKDIYAYGVTAAHDKFPAIVMTDFGRGKVLYVDLPLGYLKANADDLPLRSVLRTFLFDVAGIPHIMNVESGRGNIVINWHVDSNIEYDSLPAMASKGLLRKDIPVSFHITAGDFCYAPGDVAGFDACGKGRPLVDLMKTFGSIGSHGGWGHNWFAKNIKDGVFHEEEMRQYIVQNNDCLERITGHRIREYSAPVGVQPQPATAKLLEDLGFIAYYSTGDTGSPPNRAFYNGKMLTEKVISFPIMPFGRSASFDEMSTLDRRKEHEVREWLLDVLSYASRNRTTRLIYSHPHNITLYPHAVKAFIDRADSLQRSGSLSVRTMSDYAAFFLRFLKTTYSFSRDEKHLVVTLKNPDGLAGICAALPKKMCRKPPYDQGTVQEDDRYYYLTLVRNDTETRISVDTR